MYEGPVLSRSLLPRKSCNGMGRNTQHRCCAKPRRTGPNWVFVFGLGKYVYIHNAKHTTQYMATIWRCLVSWSYFWKPMVNQRKYANGVIKNAFEVSCGVGSCNHYIENRLERISSDTGGSGCVCVFQRGVSVVYEDMESCVGAARSVTVDHTKKGSHRFQLNLWNFLFFLVCWIFNRHKRMWITPFNCGIEAMQNARTTITIHSTGQPILPIAQKILNTN